MTVRYYLFLLPLCIHFLKLSGQMAMGEDTLVGNEWITYGQRYYKFTIEADGVYRIPKSTLDAAGITGDAVGAQMRLYSLGHQVPLHVSTDGVFESDDFIEFYGYKNRGELDQYLFLQPTEDMLNPGHSMFTDKRAYYLALEGSDPLLRVTTIPNNTSNPPATEPFYLHKEKINYNTTFNDPYHSISGGGAVSYSSCMHSEGFCKGIEINSTTSIPSLNRALAGPDAILHLRFTSTNYGNHRWDIAFNNQSLAILEAKGLEILDTSFTIPLTLLQDNNQLVITTLGSQTRHSLVEVELTYPHILTLNGSPESLIDLAPQQDDHYFVFDGFPHGGNQPIVYSTDGTKRLVADINVLQQVHWLWPISGGQSSLHIIDPAQGIRIVGSMEQKEFADLSGEDTEYVIITHPGIMSPGTDSEYIQYRSSPEGGSYKAKAYSILDLYDLFGYGIEKHPQSIRNFVEFMVRHWPSAKMIFIVGRGIEYNRSRYEGSGWESSFFVPTFGRPGADNLLAATLWDLVPRFPIGRLACTDAEGLDLYLDKVKDYDASLLSGQTPEEKAWMKRVIHISGGKDSEEQNSFKVTLDFIGQKLAESDFGAQVSYFQKESTDIVGESTSKQIEKLLHEGSAIINYLGHSSASTFEFNTLDPAEWNNQGHYPIFSAMGCSAGQIHSTLFSLSDRYVQVRDEGAIAFISGSGSQFPNALITWAAPWYDYFGNLHYGSTLGESALYGLKAVGNFVDPYLTGSNSYRYLLEQQTLQGDPALKIYPFPGPDYVVERSSVNFSPDMLNTKLDSFDLSFSILNIGRNLRQVVDYRVKLKSPGGSETLLKEGSALCGQYATKLLVRLPMPPGIKAGSYRLLIELDPDNQLAELPAPDAESNNVLRDNFGVEGIQTIILDNLVKAVYPQDFAIVNTAPELIVTGSNAFLKGQDMVIDLDTTPFFNSPFAIRQKFINRSSVLKWRPVINWIPDQVYYWRTSLDSISPEQGFIWSRRSFLYKPDSPLGWNQSRFHQVTDDDHHQLLTDSLEHTFKFSSKSKNFNILNRFHDVVQGLIPRVIEDGVIRAEFFTGFRDRNVQVFVVAIDSLTGEYMLNPNPGLYGSFSHLSFDAPCFPYRTDTPESRQDLIHFIEEIIPSGYYVFFYTYQRPSYPDYFPELWEADEAVYGKSIFSVIENQFPSSSIRTLATTGSKPYIVFFQKDRGGIQELIAEDSSGIISTSIDLKGSFHEGTHVSRLIGPASSWHSILWETELPASDSIGKNVLAAYALSSDLSDTLLISSHFVTQDTSIEGLDAKAYPYIQLTYTTQDSISFNPSDIIFWRVLFDGYPEVIIYTDVGFEFVADTLNRGEDMSLSTYVENVSTYPLDTLPVSMRIINPDHSAEEVSLQLTNLLPNTPVPVEFIKNTNAFEGDCQVLMEINQGHTVPELDHSNNIGILPMHVIGDIVNPLLDVTFDGYHIQDGDIVATNPFIRIQLGDDNSYLRLVDTTNFILFLQYPSDIQPRRIYFSEPWVHFIPAQSSGPNMAVVELTPDLWESGIYTFRVQAQDASGNNAGDNDYFVSFEVISEKSVSYIYNYPNPFNWSTRFIYTLTGESSPAFYQIEIVSITGILVRTITQDELGPLAAGNHRTEYVWDGTDQNGNELSAGIYLYRMVVKDENQKDYPRLETYANNSQFDNGWGKLIIIR